MSRKWLLLSGIIVVLATRLLMSAGGSGAFTPPLTGIPTDGSWTRSGSNPVISPTQAWEETSIQEPNMLPFGAGWIAWAKGGWASGGAVGYYTSSNGTSWTHYASNPVLGRGGSGNASTISQPSVFQDGSTFYLYANSPADTTNSAYVWTSTDGLTWTAANGGAAYITSGSITSWGNRTTWKEGSTWYQLQEGRIGSGLWQVYLLSSANGTSYSFLNSSVALTTLKPGALYNVGGPMLAGGAAIGGTYNLYFHAGTGSTSDIYHATSTDKITWTITNSGSPILTHTGTGWEIDQIADPDVHLSGGTWYLWMDAVDNTGTTGRIELATAPAT